MTTGAWICLLAPLAGALAITLLRDDDLAPRRRLDLDAGPSSSPSAAPSSRSSASSTATTRSARWSRPRGPGSRPPNFKVDLSLLVDPLSVTMMLIVSGVGGLIVLYSIGYMDGDPEERRYFAYMSLFVFSMLLLVQAGNFLLLLVGWGLVGLASYLLIGFWHEKPQAVAAAKKAFVMNAFGDATMALAFFVLIWQTGTLDFQAVVRGARGRSRRPRSTSSRSACSAARWPSRPRSRSTPGSRTRWRARRRSRR